jgi:predicted O-methyltransferase YrrM
MREMDTKFSRHFHPYISRQGVKMCRGGGLAIVELMFLDCLMQVIQPKNIFVIGNSFGWITLALGLMCPAARVVIVVGQTPDQQTIVLKPVS